MCTGSYVRHIYIHSTANSAVSICLYQNINFYIDRIVNTVNFKMHLTVEHSIGLNFAQAF